MRNFITLCVIAFSGILIVNPSRLSGQKLLSTETYMSNGVSVQNISLHTDFKGNSYSIINTSDYNPSTVVASSRIIVSNKGNLIVATLDFQSNLINVTTDSNGSVYLLGVFEGMGNISPNPLMEWRGNLVRNVHGNLNRGMFITKLDSNFNYIWGKTIEIPANMSSTHHLYVFPERIFCKNNSLILLGSLTGECDFDPSGNVSLFKPNQGGFIAEYNLLGELISVHNGIPPIKWPNIELLGTAGDVLTSNRSVEMLNNGALFISTTVSNSKLNSGKGIIRLVKFDSNFTLLKDIYLASNSVNSNAVSLGLANYEDKIIISGHFQDSIDFTGIGAFKHFNKVQNGLYTSFIACYDTNLNYLWHRIVPNSNYASNPIIYNNNIVVLSNGNKLVYVSIDGILLAEYSVFNAWNTQTTKNSSTMLISGNVYERLSIQDDKIIIQNSYSSCANINNSTFCFYPECQRTLPNNFSIKAPNTQNPSILLVRKYQPFEYVSDYRYTNKEDTICSGSEIEIILNGSKLSCNQKIFWHDRNNEGFVLGDTLKIKVYNDTTIYYRKVSSDTNEFKYYFAEFSDSVKIKTIAKVNDSIYFENNSGIIQAGDSVIISSFLKNNLFYTWYLNELKIVESPTASSITATKDGVYSLKYIGKNNCLETSNKLEVSYLSNIGQVGNINEYRVYPNPFEGNLNVSGVEGEIYKIVDLKGKSLLSGYFESNDIEIEVSNLTSGIYFLIISNVIKGEVFHFKVLKF